MKKLIGISTLAFVAVMCCSTANAQPAPAAPAANAPAVADRGARMTMDANTSGPRMMRERVTSGPRTMRDGMTSGPRMMMRGDRATSMTPEMAKMREQMVKAREAISKLSPEDQTKVRELRGEERAKFLKEKGIEMPAMGGMMGRRGPGAPPAGGPGAPPPPPADPAKAN